MNLTLSKHRKIFQAMLFVPMMFLGIFILIFVLSTRKFKTSDAKVSSVHVTLAPSISPISGENAGIPIKDNTISYTVFKNNIYLRYKDVIYSQDGADRNPIKTVLPNTEKLNWVGIVDGTTNTANPVPLDDIFSFKIYPDKLRFLFVTQWDKWLVVSRTAGQEYHIYYYDLTQTYPQDRLEMIYTSSSSGQTNFAVPKIDQISADGKYASFSLFKCWGCQSAVGETLLWDDMHNNIKNVGRVTDFAWLNDGAYQFKPYIVIPCANEQASECSQDPQTIPLQIGQF